MKLDKRNSKNPKLKYKALMIDVDGTLIDYAKNALPSPKVTSAVKKAQSLMHVGVATSRGYEETVQIAKYLGLNGPSILNGGALIVDFETNKTLWEKPIPQDVAVSVAKIFNKLGEKLIVNDFEGDRDVTQTNLPKKAFNMFSPALTLEKAQKVFDELSNFDQITASYVPSWERGKFDMLVYQASATKLHGIFETAKILKLMPKDFIVIGDGYNDFPLLEAAGLKIAMGNAAQDLKAIADHIAPSVYEDGVAWAIEEFILKKNQ